MRKSLFYTSESTFSCRYNALPVYPKSPFHGVIVRISCAGTSQTVVRNGFYRFPALSFAISYCQNILLPYVYIYAVRKSLSLRVLIVDTFPSHRAIIINETFRGLHLVLFSIHDSNITTSLYMYNRHKHHFLKMPVNESKPFSALSVIIPHDIFRHSCK